MQKNTADIFKLISNNKDVANLMTMQPKDPKEAKQFREFKIKKVIHLYFMFVFIRFVNFCANLLVYFCFSITEEKDLACLAIEILLSVILGLIALKYNQLTHVLGFLLFLYYYTCVLLFS